MHARLAFGILLALGLVDLAVLDLHLAPQLATLDAPVPKPSASSGPAVVKTSVAAQPTTPAKVPSAQPTTPPISTSAVAAVSATAPSAPASAAAPPPTGPEPKATASVAAAPPSTAPATPAATTHGEAMPDLLFDLDSHLVESPQALADLKRVAEELKHDPSKRLLVRGHSDQMGSPEYKRALSQRRAATVQGFLISHGAPADRISLEAASDTEPVDNGSNPVSWAKNRRVQLLWR